MRLQKRSPGLETCDTAAAINPGSGQAANETLLLGKLLPKDSL